MSDESGPLELPRRKRGRPPGSLSKTRRKPAPSPDSSSDEGEEPRLLQRYQETQRAFERNDSHAMTLQMLRRVAAEPALAQLSPRDSVLQQVMDVAKKTQLTELEVTVWALHLAKAKLVECELPLHGALLISAFYVKEGLDADVKPLRALLERQSAAFTQRLELWAHLHPREIPSIQEVQAKWRQLKKPISQADLSVINYNYYVDDLLQTGLTPVDTFTGGESYSIWRPEDSHLIKPMPTQIAAYETAEEFPVAWFEPVPLSPGMLFFGFTPPPSAMLQTEDQFH